MLESKDLNQELEELLDAELTEEEIDKGMQEIYGDLYIPLIKPSITNGERLNLFKNRKSKK